MLSVKNLKDLVSYTNSTFTIPKQRRGAHAEANDNEEVIVFGRNKFDQKKTSITHKDSRKNKDKSHSKEVELRNKSQISRKRNSIDDKSKYSYQVKVSTIKQSIQDKRGSSRVENKRGSLES